MRVQMRIRRTFWIKSTSWRTKVWETLSKTPLSLSLAPTLESLGIYYRKPSRPSLNCLTTNRAASLFPRDQPIPISKASLVKLHSGPSLGCPSSLRQLVRHQTIAKSLTFMEIKSMMPSLSKRNLLLLKIPLLFFKFRSENWNWALRKRRNR